ncbi:HEPN domain-containing protein [Gillisia sp. JM1]|uniref:ApeA N-terminal domain 1-containing protein n=1 Tax=Gillisia sp. JM1 TaxID=1283286 RepID=UPI0004233F4F|nr:HEPN domain-containing protein [Gillisia sp. JM1]
MITTKTYKGKFKTPDSDEWFNGTLSYDPERGSELEIFGSFNPFLFDRSTKPIIMGHTSEGKVTLIDNWYKKTKTTRDNVVIGTYHPNIILEGHNFKKIDDIKFDKVIFQVFNLFEWIGKTGQKSDFKYDNSDEYYISYKAIEEINFSLNKQIDGSITFDGPVSLGGKANRMELHEEAYVTLKYQKSKKLELIIKDITTFIDSITIFTNEQSYPTKITLKDSSLKREKSRINEEKLIHCNYQNSFYNSQHKTRHIGEFIVDFDDIESDFPVLISKWFELYENLDSVLLLFLKHFKDKYRFSSDKFMDTIRAVENFHRIKFNNERITQERFDKLVSKIINQVNLDSKDSEWLTGRLQGNEPTLKNRLKELIEVSESKTIKDRAGKIKKFCWEVTSSRNYYTHYDRKLKETAKKGSELYELTRTLRAILTLYILKEIGINYKDFSNNLKYHFG